MARAIDFLRAEQMPDGSWFGRWGTNYIYGTWSVLMAFAQAGIGPDDATVQRAVEWLDEHQNADGGWGESNDSYGWQITAGRGQHAEQSLPDRLGTAGIVGGWPGGLERRSSRHRIPVADPGDSDGLWSDPTFTAPGFPRVFYLKYHGYCAYFPLWALAAYRNLSRAGAAH